MGYAHPLEVPGGGPGVSVAVVQAGPLVPVTSWVAESAGGNALVPIAKNLIGPIVTAGDAVVSYTTKWFQEKFAGTVLQWGTNKALDKLTQDPIVLDPEGKAESTLAKIENITAELEKIKILIAMNTFLDNKIVPPMMELYGSDLIGFMGPYNPGQYPTVLNRGLVTGQGMGQAGLSWYHMAMFLGFTMNQARRKEICDNNGALIEPTLGLEWGGMI